MFYFVYFILTSSLTEYIQLHLRDTKLSDYCHELQLSLKLKHEPDSENDESEDFNRIKIMIGSFSDGIHSLIGLNQYGSVNVRTQEKMYKQFTAKYRKDKDGKS